MLFIKLDACISGPYDGVIVVVVGGCVASGNNVPSCVLPNVKMNYRNRKK